MKNSHRAERENTGTGPKLAKAQHCTSTAGSRPEELQAWGLILGVTVLGQSHPVFPVDPTRPHQSLLLRVLAQAEGADSEPSYSSRRGPHGATAGVAHV